MSKYDKEASRRYYTNPANKAKLARARRNWNLKKWYGIDINQYEAMHAKQDGRCAICGRHESSMSRKLAVDHDHSNGRIRGLLCLVCNNVVGLHEHGLLPSLDAIIKYLG